MLMALTAATRGTCARRRVGCVLVDGHRHQLATGYNGPESGAPHCVDVPCPGANYRSGDGLDACEAIHAEMNALLQCSDQHAIDVVYCTLAPCVTCVKLLLNTSCGRIVFLDDYNHVHMTAAEKRWTRTFAPSTPWRAAATERRWVKLDP